MINLALWKNLILFWDLTGGRQGEAGAGNRFAIEADK